MSKPYYQDDYVTLYNGDCREIVPQLEKINVILTDPPFFMPAVHYQSRKKYQRAWSDTSILGTFWEVIVDLCLSKLKETGHFLTFCNGDSYPVFYPTMYRRFDFLKCLVWDKGHVGLGRIWRNQHELVIAGRWNTSLFYEENKLRSDVFTFKATPSNDREHPVEKPVSMLKWLLEPLIANNGILLDPFAGSGTTGIAAKELNKKCILIEKEEKYCKIAARRLSQDVFNFNSEVSQ